MYYCSFELNLKYTDTSESCTDARPTVVVLSTRYVLINLTFEDWTPMLVYTAGTG